MTISQVVRLEAEQREAEASAVDFQEQLQNALCQAKAVAADLEAARSRTRETEVRIARRSFSPRSFHFVCASPPPQAARFF